MVLINEKKSSNIEEITEIFIETVIFLVSAGTIVLVIELIFNGLIYKRACQSYAAHNS